MSKDTAKIQFGQDDFVNKGLKQLDELKPCGLSSESVGWDLTPIGMMVSRVELPLPNWEGHGRGFYLVRWRGLWQSKGSVLDGLGFSPLGDIVPEAWRSGRRERGFIVESPNAYQKHRY